MFDLWTRQVRPQNVKMKLGAASSDKSIRHYRAKDKFSIHFHKIPVIDLNVYHPLAAWNVDSPVEIHFHALGRVDFLLGYLPEILGQVDFAFGNVPELLGYLPELPGQVDFAFGNVSERLGNQSELLGKVKSAFWNCPDGFGHLPRVFG